MATASANVKAAWEKRANWLAHWTMARLVNRTDLWIRYLAKDKHRKTESGQLIQTRLGPIEKKRGKLKLTEKALERHYRGGDSGHLLGIHSVSAGSTSRWIAVNLERPGGKSVPLHNLRAATHWRDELIAMGFRPLLIDTDGAGGYYVLVLFREPLAAAKANEFAQMLVRDYADVGLAEQPTILPNGPIFDESDWLRLPGRHPVTGEWSRVWNGHRWLEGADAVEAILHAHGDSPTLIRKLVNATFVAPTLAPTPAGNNGNALPPAPVVEKAATSSKDSKVEIQVLSYLLAATRGEDPSAAFAAVAAADLNPDAFRQPINRQVFQSLLKLNELQARMTPTLISEQIPEDQRSAALELIDRVMLQKPVDVDEYENLLTTLSNRTAVAISTPPEATSSSNTSTSTGTATLSDTDLEQIVRLWPGLSAPIRHALLTLALSAGPA